MPTILLDKTAFESLNPAEHELLDRLTHQVIPPLLIMEVLGDAAKEGTPGANPWIQVLAKKFIGSGSPVAAEWETMMCGSLLGEAVKMTRQIPMGHGKLMRSQDGALGLVVSDHPMNLAVMRWADGEVADWERNVAEEWRSGEFQFTVQEFRKWVTLGFVRVPKVRSYEEAVRKAKEWLSRPSQLRLWITAAGNVAGLDDRQVRRAIHLAEASGSPMEACAPFAHECMTAFLSTLIAWQSALIPNDANNGKDAMYLCYLPFAYFFVSDDRLHTRLAPHLIREDQTFMTGVELKAEIAIIREESDRLGFDLSYGSPRALQHIADRSKLITGLLRLMKPVDDDEAAADEDSDSRLTPVDVIVDRMKNSKEVNRPRVGEEVTWMSMQRFLPASVVRDRYGEEALERIREQTED